MAKKEKGKELQIQKEFFEALIALETQNGISRETFLKALEDALAIAYKKHSGEPSRVSVKLDEVTTSIKYFSIKKIVENEESLVNPDIEITIEEANDIKPGDYKAGDELIEEIFPKDFGRIAAMTAKQVLQQKLREIERNNTVSEFEDREDELMVCTVRRIEDGNVYVEIGGSQIEGVLLPKDQVPGEKYEVNQKLNVLVKKVKNTGRTAQIMVSRTATGLVGRLFENEVPEIKQGIVQIKAIAREAGQRTKIAIYSEDPSIDALGACVGNKGARVNAVVAELGGEKIDIIVWSENPLEFISKALSPARVVKVIQMEGENSAMAIVPDDKLSLAIGRSGQNARLAVRLTGWKIDVKSESVAQAEFGEEIQSDIVEENA